MIAVVTHGVAGRSDLPLPLWLFAYGAGFALLISFLLLRLLWPRPRLAAAADGRPVPAGGWIGTAAPIAMRAIGLFWFLLVLTASIWGIDESGANIAPYAVYVVFWVGFIVVCGLVGDVYASLNPFDTLALLARIPERTARTGPGQWPAALFLFSFVWLELTYQEPSSPRVIATWLVLYTVAALGCAALWGRTWLRQGEGFAALFGLVGHVAPIGRDPTTRRLRLRAPLAGLANVPVVAGTAAVIIVALGSTTFDGASRTQFWTDIVGSRTGWSATTIKTLGLLWVIAIVATLYLGAIAATARITGHDARELAAMFLPSLIPIALAYAIAHYFSLLIFDSQNFYALLSDPFGKGWDLFGTINYTVDYRLVSVRTIALVQAGAIVIGHVSGVIVAHDRAVGLFPTRLVVKSQYPLLAVMIVYTIGGLLILLGG